ncbi:MAG: TonB-dependent receptor, partial [Dysgonamonadaceae bacterium]|nr:TonB-dependent receptor [Dysgonamonadaceae bacterium]
IGVLTDSEGKFSLDVPESATTLVISYIGYKEKEVDIAPYIEVIIEQDVSDLDEVIVVAYGTAKKSTFTGSASVVKSKDIAKLQTGNVTHALEGAASGVQVISGSGQPGSSASIRIRGVGSYSASTTPLYVVDGVPFQGNINSINSMDIESMTVLKDAAANSLYGSRASNGVILITTKKGAEGKARVTFEARYGLNQRGIPNYDVLDDPAEFYELTWEGLRNRQYYSVGNSWLQAANYASNNLISQLGNYNNYNVPDNEVVDINGNINPNARLKYREDWNDFMFNNGNRQEYIVSISGGDAKTNYYLSLGYLNDEGFVANSDFERYTSRLRLEKEVTDWFKVGGTANYIRQESNFVGEDGTQGSNMFFLSQTMPPIYPVYLHDPVTGDIVLDDKGNKVYDFGDDSSLGYGRLVSSMANPVASQILDVSQDVWDIFDGKVFADFTVKDFKLSLNYAINSNNNLGLSYLNGIYGQFKDQGGYSTRYGQRITVQSANQLLTWTKELANKHNVDVLIGHENYNYKFNEWYGTKEKFLDPDQRELVGAIKNPLSSSYENNYRMESYLSRVQYNYESKYYASASFRLDGSSKFHKDHRWGNFWSAGASWRISKESFMSSVDWVSDLKFKASYGTQGNDQISGVLPWADQYRIVNNSDNISLLFDYKGNPEITWESSQTFNTGFDYSFLDRKLYGAIEYFHKNTTDMLYSRPVPSSGGYTSYPDNIGDMVNQGVELEITGVLVHNNDFEWNISFNGTWFTNEITKLPPERMEDGITDGVYKLMVGKSRYEYFTREYAGIDVNGQAQWYKDVLDDNGNPTGERETTTTYSAATDYFQGSAIPDLYGGFGTYLKYKGFDFSLQASYQLGGKGYDNAYALTMAGSDLGFNMHKDLRNRWTPTHTDTDIPRIQMGNANTSTNSRSSRWFVDASYINIRNITLGYELPKRLLNKIYLESLRIYVVADNVALFSKRQGYDPRTSWSGSSSYGLYPVARTFSIGFNLAF